MNITLTNAQFEKLLSTISLKEAKRAIAVLNKRLKKDTNHGFDISIQELGLSARATNGLKKLGITTVQELSERGIECLYDVGNVGKKTLNEIEIALHKAINPHKKVQ